MDHVIFSRNAREITIVFQTLKESSSPFLRSLAQKIDNGIEGSIWKLKLDEKTLCWKSPDAQTMPSTQLPPTIGVGDFMSHETSVAFLRSLRLDQLRALEVNRFIDKEEWSLFGDLPCLTDLRLVKNALGLLFFFFLRGTANVAPDPDTPPLRPAFAALQKLTIVRWNFKAIADKKNRSVIQCLEHCLKRRKKAGAPLHHLRLEHCRGVEQDYLARLRKLIEQVDWDEYYRYVRTSESEDSDYY
ncbi:hypothetical protein C0995_015470 [Termitomyces sp. Mi166|nr:hypothetical protein C0995_015470 [Termitomyces sp. Mi166\